MNLIFSEYINFLNDKGLNEFLKENNSELKIQEGYYWLDRQIIKCYDKQGKIHKMLRVYIDDNLDITFKLYKNKDFEMESWQNTIERNKERLRDLEWESFKLIKNSLSKYKGYKPITLTSTGKDSQLVTYLVEQFITTRKLFNNTTLDCADTYKFVKQMKDVEIITPKEGFYQWRERLNFVPTRFSRACCSVFKEQELVNKLNKDEKYLFFMGMRNEESNTRSGYTDEWKNDKWGNREWQGILVIRKWTEEDVWLYTLMKNIPINPKYKKGYNRIGCAISCPFYAKSTWVLDKYWYPKMYDRWHKILERDFIENKKACIMNCTLDEYYLKWNGGIVHDKPSEKVIQEFAKQQDLDINIAKKYFNKTCMCCDKKLKKDDIGLSMKYYGRQIEQFKCVNCISKELSINKNEIKEQIRHFKDTGCSLF